MNRESKTALARRANAPELVATFDAAVAHAIAEECAR
jgi:hypothetical protein